MFEYTFIHDPYLKKYLCMAHSQNTFLLIYVYYVVEDTCATDLSVSWNQIDIKQWFKVYYVIRKRIRNDLCIFCNQRAIQY